ncbi:MAG: endonuclease/exonuclease/phosphatase family protein [Planctomycetes bacterium]|nr:endonuclease/exonuclease/phosphatase family protein [Planctomycetota bacterium]
MLAGFLLLVVSTPLCLAGAALTVTVCQFNIRFDFEADGENRWVARAPLVAGLLAASKASIACLQEDKPDQVEDLKSHLPGWEFVGSGRDRGRTERCSVGFDANVWRVLEHGDFWLSDTPDVPGSSTWGCKYPHKVTWARLAPRAAAGRPTLLCLSTHLEEDPEKGEVRTKSVRVIRTWLAQHAAAEAVVVCGDFNAGETEPAHVAMMEPTPAPRLIDVWEAVRPNESNPGTVHRFTGRSQKKRSDWIIVAGRVTPRKVQLDRWNRNGRYPSDHFALVAELEIEAGGAGGKGKDAGVTPQVK